MRGVRAPTIVVSRAQPARSVPSTSASSSLLRPSISTLVRTMRVGIALPLLASLATPAPLGGARTARRGGAPPRDRRQTSGDDVRVRAAAAEVAGDRARHVLRRRLLVRPQQAD